MRPGARRAVRRRRGSRQLSLRARASILYDLAVGYQCLVEVEAPEDMVAGVAYWIRRATREGLTSADLEHALEATLDGNVSPLARKKAP